MGFNKPIVMGHSAARQPIQGYGFVVGDGATDPTDFGGFVAAAVRLETAGAVPFLRITLDTALNLDRVAILPTLRGSTYGKVQVTSLTATVGGAPDSIRQVDVVYFDATGAEIEPIADARLDLTIVGDKATQ